LSDGDKQSNNCDDSFGGQGHLKAGKYIQTSLLDEAITLYDYIHWQAVRSVIKVGHLFKVVLEGGRSTVVPVPEQRFLGAEPQRRQGQDVLGAIRKSETSRP
jgi:hypothetical protein